MRLEEFFLKYRRGAGVGVANEFAAEIRRILSVQAPVRTTRSGRIVAATRATPYAPPRMVTGALRRSVAVVPTAHGARVVVWKPYGVPLEKGTSVAGFPHKFVAVALENLGLSGRATAGGPTDRVQAAPSRASSVIGWLGKMLSRLIGRNG